MLRRFRERLHLGVDAAAVVRRAGLPRAGGLWQTRVVLPRPRSALSHGVDPVTGRAAAGSCTEEGASRRVGFTNPVVGILLLAGLFDGLSGNPMGGLLLVTVGVGLARSRAEAVSNPDAGGFTPRLRRPVPWTRTWTAGCVIGGYGALAGTPARFSWPATAAVSVAGVAVLVLAGRSAARYRAVPPARPAGSAAWAAVFVGIALWELVNLLLQPSFTTGSYDHPTLSVLADPMLASTAGRSAALTAWLGAGWYLVDR
ncbi:MAG: hypothetical protein ABIJ48_10550 [Actinomycetota bacterium]